VLAETFPPVSKNGSFLHGIIPIPSKKFPIVFHLVSAPVLNSVFENREMLLPRLRGIGCDCYYDNPFYL